VPEVLPHLIAVLNAIMTVSILRAYTAIRKGDRAAHRRRMHIGLTAGALFLIVYVVQVEWVGHKHFPGDDWVRTLFLVILSSHTLLAIAVVPFLLRVLYLAVRGRFSLHRRLARWVFPIWLYVAITGLVIYWMTNHLRPAG